MSNTFSITYAIEVPRLDQGDLVKLSFRHTNNKAVQFTLTGNGVQHGWFVPDAAGNLPYRLFLDGAPERIAENFDPLGYLATKLDHDWLYEKLVAQATEKGLQEKWVNEIRTASMATHPAALYAIGNPLMVELFGPNWVAEQSSTMIKQSKDWKALVERVQVAQDALKDALPS